MTAIADAIEAAGARAGVRCLVVRGAGGHFSAGDDLFEAAAVRPTAWAATIDGFQRLTRVVLESPVPVIAAIDGGCIGGALEFAASCDVRIGTGRVALRHARGPHRPRLLQRRHAPAPRGARRDRRARAAAHRPAEDAGWMNRHGFFNEVVDDLDAGIADWSPRSTPPPRPPSPARRGCSTSATATCSPRRWTARRTLRRPLPHRRGPGGRAALRTQATRDVPDALPRAVPDPWPHAHHRSPRHRSQLPPRPHVRPRLAPGDPGWDEARHAWNLAVDQRPAAVAIPESSRRRRRRRRSPANAACASPRRAPATTPPPRHARRHDPLKTARAARRRDRRRRRARPRRAGALWSDVTEPASEHGLAPLAGSSPDVGVVGYIARRRPRLARPQVRPPGQQRRRIELVTADGDVAAPTPPTTSPTCSGRCAAAAATSASSPRSSSASTRVPRSTAACCSGRGSAPRGAQGLARLDAHRARRGHHQGAPVAVPAAPGHPEFLRGRPLVVIDGAYLGDQRAGAELLRRCATSAPRSTRSARCRRPALLALHMDPEGPTPGSATGACSTSSPTRRSTPSSRPPARARTRRCSSRSCATWAARSPAPRRVTGRSRRSTASTSPFAAGLPMTPELGAADPRRLCRPGRRAGPVGRRLGLPQLHRGDRRPGACSTRPRPTSGCAASRPRSTRTGCSAATTQSRLVLISSPATCSAEIVL